MGGRTPGHEGNSRYLLVDPNLNVSRRVSVQEGPGRVDWDYDELHTSTLSNPERTSGVGEENDHISPTTDVPPSPRGTHK